MIKYFRWKNFLSFKDEGEVSFEVDDQAPQTGAFTKCGHTRLSKIEGILGPNASGKSNVLKALAFIKYFIIDSFHFKDDGFPPFYRPYMFNQDKSVFNIGFFIDKIYYEYAFEVQGQRVLSEKLQKTLDNKTKIVFERKNQKFLRTDFESKQQDLFKSNIHLTPLNASIISTFARTNEAEMQKIKTFWEHQILPFLPIPNQIILFDEISRDYLKDKDLVEQMEDILKNLDLGEHTFGFKKGTFFNEQNQPIPIITPFMSRRDVDFPDKHFELPLFEESHGTVNLFIKLCPILKAIKDGTLIMIDELENGIHTEAFFRILHLFTKTHHQGQILFVTHASSVLMHLNKFQVHLTEKTKDNKSSIYRLDQVDGIKDTDNLFKQYISGSLGGFPDIDY